MECVQRNWQYPSQIWGHFVYVKVRCLPIVFGLFLIRAYIVGAGIWEFRPLVGGVSCSFMSLAQVQRFTLTVGTRAITDSLYAEFGGLWFQLMGMCATTRFSRPCSLVRMRNDIMVSYLQVDCDWHIFLVSSHTNYIALFQSYSSPLHAGLDNVSPYFLAI